MDNYKSNYLTAKEALTYLKKKFNYEIPYPTFARHSLNDLKLPCIVDGKNKLYLEEDLDRYYKYREVNRINSEAIVLTFANHKGGVGKTVSVYNLSAAFAKYLKHKILVLDFDPQANLSLSYDIDMGSAVSIDEVIFGNATIKDAIIEINEFVDVIPSYKELCMFDLQPNNNISVNHLSNLIAEIKSNYDYIFIDCPPQISKLTYSSIVAGDHLFIPMKPDLYSVEGLSTFMEYAKQFNNDIEISGVFITFYDKRQILDNSYIETLIERYPDLILKTMIRKNIAVSESVVFKKNIFDFDLKSSGASDYKRLAYEIYNKVGGKNG